MRHINVRTIFRILMTACLLLITGCTDAPEPSENEILLAIQLDLKEDIGLLVLDQNLSGQESIGGISNADRSLLKHDEVLYWTFDKEDYKDLPDTIDLTLGFRIITEYCDPNYENIYPEELTVYIDSISFPASFGDTCHITITGDHAHGYQAVHDQN